MAKISYEDKVKVKDIAVAEVNKFTNANANEIKEVVNGLDNAIIGLQTGSPSNIVVSAIWVSGLTFDCVASSYPIIDTYYSAPNTTLTLSDSDPALDRIDLIVASINGTIEIIEGDLATTELVVPPDYDPSIYFVIKQIIVRANATVPTDNNGNTLATETVYSDGLGEPNEWTFSSNSANIVNSGGVINATNVTYGNYPTLSNNAVVSGLNSDKSFSLSFDITLKESLGNSFIFVKFFNSEGTQIINSKLFRNGNYGFNGNLLTPQTVILDGDEFTFRELTDIYKVQIYAFKNFLGYTLDNIKFNVGSDTTTTIPNTTFPEYRLGTNVADKVPLLKDGVQVSELDLTPYVGGGSSEPSQITITTTTSITTDTTDGTYSQSGKNTILDNGVNAINLTVNGGVDFVTSYLKHGTGAITFVQGVGRTLVQVDGTAVLDGAVGSTATISSVGTTDYLRISNV